MKTTPRCYATTINTYGSRKMLLDVDISDPARNNSGLSSFLLVHLTSPSHIPPRLSTSLRQGDPQVEAPPYICNYFESSSIPYRDDQLDPIHIYSGSTITIFYHAMLAALLNYAVSIYIIL
ncbi:hypothetical protein BZA70DRAFT_286564 [Myxozyma melibiosi]|uniref:Uncharacterized protein n=1 Tax=Myxozyma melibiosi TaxID=54550 RepID=A0ABR1FBG6_9ASCO